MVKARHTVTGIVVEIPDEQFAAMAFTGLGAVYDVLPADYDAGCIDCGDNAEPDDIEEDEELDLGDGYDFYDNQEEDYNRG